VSTLRDSVEGVDDELGPVAADDIGDLEEETPFVAEAVAGGFGHRWFAGGNGVEVVGGPAGELGRKEVFALELLGVERGEGDVFGRGNHVDGG